MEPETRRGGKRGARRAFVAEARGRPTGYGPDVIERMNFLMDRAAAPKRPPSLFAVVRRLLVRRLLVPGLALLFLAIGALSSLVLVAAQRIRT